MSRHATPMTVLHNKDGKTIYRFAGSVFYVDKPDSLNPMMIWGLRAAKLPKGGIYKCVLTPREATDPAGAVQTVNDITVYPIDLVYDAKKDLVVSIAEKGLADLAREYAASVICENQHIECPEWENVIKYAEKH